MVVIEIVRAVLAEIDDRHAQLFHGADVSSAIGGVRPRQNAERREHALEGARVRQSGFAELRIEAPDAAGAEIAFEGDDVARGFARMCAAVRSAAVDAVFFRAREQDADGAAWAARQIADQTRGGAYDGDAGAVIDGALPHVP